MPTDEADVAYLKEDLRVLRLNRERLLRANGKAREEFRHHYELVADLDSCLRRIENGTASERDRGVVDRAVGRGYSLFTNLPN